LGRSPWSQVVYSEGIWAYLFLRGFL